jgi:uncharacterized membrane protein
MAKKRMNKEDEKKLYAFLGVFLTVIGFIIAMAVKRNDKYVMFYGKQGLVLFLAWIVVWVAAAIFSIIPFLGWIIMWAAYLCMLVLWVIGIINSLSGEMKEIPVIGQFARKINL